ncbi:MAG: hypothetical protein ACK5MB_06510, partial [Phycisphaerales bacterium]
MSASERHAASIRSRLRRASALSAAARWAALGSAISGISSVSLHALNVAPLAATPTSLAILLAPPVLLSMIAGVLAARSWRGRPGLIRAASIADARLNLNDQLIIALQVGASTAMERFARAEADDAIRAITPARIAAAFPMTSRSTALRFGSALAALAAGASVLLLTPVGILRQPANSLLATLGITDSPRPIRVTPEQRAADAARAAESVRQLREQLQAQSASQNERTAQTADAGSASALSELSRIESELRSGQISPDESRTRSAKAVESLAGELSRQAQRDRDAADALARRLSEQAAAREQTPARAARSTGSAPGPTPGSPSSSLDEATAAAGDTTPEAPADNLREAITRGD